MQEDCAVRIFVYPLPNYTAVHSRSQDNATRDIGAGEPWWLGSAPWWLGDLRRPADNRALNAAVRRVWPSWRAKLAIVDPYTLGQLVHHQLLASPCRAATPDEAELFFVPLRRQAEAGRNGLAVKVHSAACARELRDTLWMRDTVRDSRHVPYTWIEEMGVTTSS